MHDDQKSKFNIEMGILPTPNTTTSTKLTESIYQLQLQNMDDQGEEINDAILFAHHFNVINFHSRRCFMWVKQSRKKCE